MTKYVGPLESSGRRRRLQAKLFADSFYELESFARRSLGITLSNSAAGRPLYYVLLSKNKRELSVHKGAISLSAEVMQAHFSYEVWRSFKKLLASIDRME